MDAGPRHMGLNGGGVMNRRREELRGKYLKLGVGELAAAAVFAFVAVAAVVPRLHGPADSMAL